MVVAAALTLTGCGALDPRQADPPPPGIARIETITIDGLPERLLIRGRDARNPVLLFVHGGPGFPAAVFQATNSDLERDFTVVHWDQRSSGYSYVPGIPPATMNVEQFVRETLTVTRALCQELHQPKIYVLGHSWGSLPATLAVARHPELYYAYIGVSQLVDITESERCLVDEAIRQAQAQGNTRRVEELRALGPPPFDHIELQDRASVLIERTIPPTAKRISTTQLALLGLNSRYYRLPALLHANDSYRYSRRVLDPQLAAYHLRRQVPELDVPVYFFVGTGDVMFGVSIQEEYFRALVAPKGKHFLLFTNSTHWPHLEQPPEFLAAMQRVRAETYPARPAE